MDALPVVILFGGMAYATLTSLRNMRLDDVKKQVWKCYYCDRPASAKYECENRECGHDGEHYEYCPDNKRNHCKKCCAAFAAEHMQGPEDYPKVTCRKHYREHVNPHKQPSMNQ